MFFVAFFETDRCFSQQEMDTINTTFYLEKFLFRHGDSINCVQLRTNEEGFFNFSPNCQTKYENLVSHHVSDKYGVWVVEKMNYKCTGRIDTLVRQYNDMSLSENFWFSFVQDRLLKTQNVRPKDVEKKVRLTFPVSDQDSIYDFCVIDLMDYTDSIKIFSYYGRSEDRTGLSYILSDSLLLSERERKKITKFLNKVKPIDIACKFRLDNWLYEISEKGKETVYYTLSDRCAMNSRSRKYKFRYRLYHYLRYLCSEHFDWYPQEDKYYL